MVPKVRLHQQAIHPVTTLPVSDMTVPNIVHRSQAYNHSKCSPFQSCLTFRRESGSRCRSGKVETLTGKEMQMIQPRGPTLRRLSNLGNGVGRLRAIMYERSTRAANVSVLGWIGSLLHNHPLERIQDNSSRRRTPCCAEVRLAQRVMHDKSSNDFTLGWKVRKL
jgi:hypothetical protein